MRVPRYAPSSVTSRLKRRIFMTLLVALLAMVTGFLSYPLVIRGLYFRQLQSADHGTRVRALNALSALAIDDPQLAARLPAPMVELLSTDDAGQRRAVIAIAAWAIGHLPGVQQRLETRLDGSDDVVFAGLAAALRQAGQWDHPDRPAGQRCRWVALACRTEDGDLLCAALQRAQALGPVCGPWLEEPLRRSTAHSSAAVRLAAVHLISICRTDWRVLLLQQAASDPVLAVRAEAQARLALLGSPSVAQPAHKPDLQEISRALQSGTYERRIQAIEALLRCPRFGDRERAPLIADLRSLVQQGLSIGNGGLAGQALLGLAHLGDRAYLPVMLDVSAGFAAQPMLRLMAARAAAGLDPQGGGAALVNLFDQDQDTIRDLAAFELARLDHDVITRRLRSELFSLDHQVRGPAALALALTGQAQLEVRGMTFRELLERRTDLAVDNIHAEVDWKPRGYYLCARLILGDQRARQDLDLFILNEHFPRLAIYITLLQAGESEVLDLILGSDPQEAPRVMPILRDQGAGAIIHRYLPQAPQVSWAVPAAERVAQTAQLIRWWSIYRWQMEFDTPQKVYLIGPQSEQAG